jgi:transposase
MILPEHVHLAIEAVDMRWGADRLSLCVQHSLGKSPCDGTVYVFSNRRRTRLKLLVWDGTGVWLCQRRLHRGAFVWPTAQDATCRLAAEQSRWLITGVDWQRLSCNAHKNWHVSLNKALFRQGIRELGCWAHAHRKFFELHTTNQSPMAAEALERIGKLYTIEQQAKNMTPEQRQAVRQRESVPLLQSLHDWLHHTHLSPAQGSSSTKAIDYTLRRWEALIRYAQTGDLPIDNNPVENAIRPIALGKKNWLFAVGRRAAAIQSLLGTAKLNGLDPLAWLKDTLEKLPIWPNRRIDELLPFKR